MSQARAIAAFGATSPLAPHTVERRSLGAHDVHIDIAFCGICHSDIHQARNEWGGSIYPMVPGHEVVGRVGKVGAAVTRFKEGAWVGVGCFVDSCRSCGPCRAEQQQFCDQGMVATYNSVDPKTKTPTYGGYSNFMVVDENYVLRLEAGLHYDSVAPLLCAGITTYSPLARYAPQGPVRVAVMGLGGLGHMAVKIAAAMGHEVSVLSSSPSKRSDAKRLGAHEFVLTKAQDTDKKIQNRYDLIINTVSAVHDINTYLSYLNMHGTMVMLGVAPEALPLHAFALIGRGRRLAGSLIGGIRETQAMLDFCAAKKIVADVEVCSSREVNAAYARVLKNEVKYRFVIDMSTL